MEAMQTDHSTESVTVQDEERWAQNVGGYMRGLLKPGSMSEAAPVLIQLKHISYGVIRNV